MQQKTTCRKKGENTSSLLIVLLTFKKKIKTVFRIAKYKTTTRKNIRMGSGVVISIDLEAAMMEELRPP